MLKMIHHFIVLGDSISDLGVTNARHRIIREIAGLVNTSPLGRFSNARVWVDYINLQFLNIFIIKYLTLLLDLTPCDISDGIIHQDKRIKNILKNLPKNVFYNKTLFFRNYSEGGVTAHNYKWTLSNPVQLISRFFVPCLEEKVTEMLKDNALLKITPETKDKTLIIEFVSVNDLLSAENDLSQKKINLIIDARMQNIERLIKNGYKNFILLNLTDLSFTPRYYKHPRALLIKQFCATLNRQLITSIKKLQQKHFICSINIFDVNAEFKKIYDYPEIFQYDKTKRNKSFKHSLDFKPVASKGISHAGGYMFWDTVHPTDSVHYRIADSLREFIQKKYNVNILIRNSSRTP